MFPCRQPGRQMCGRIHTLLNRHPVHEETVENVANILRGFGMCSADRAISEMEVNDGIMYGLETRIFSFHNNTNSVLLIHPSRKMKKVRPSILAVVSISGPNTDIYYIYKIF